MGGQEVKKKMFPRKRMTVGGQNDVEPNFFIKVTHSQKRKPERGQGNSSTRAVGREKGRKRGDMLLRREVKGGKRERPTGGALSDPKSRDRVPLRERREKSFRRKGSWARKRSATTLKPAALQRQGKGGEGPISGETSTQMGDAKIQNDGKSIGVPARRVGSPCKSSQVRSRRRKWPGSPSPWSDPCQKEKVEGKPRRKRRNWGTLSLWEIKGARAETL